MFVFRDAYKKRRKSPGLQRNRMNEECVPAVSSVHHYTIILSLSSHKTSLFVGPEFLWLQAFPLHYGSDQGYWRESGVALWFEIELCPFACFAIIPIGISAFLLARTYLRAGIGLFTH